YRRAIDEALQNGEVTTVIPLRLRLGRVLVDELNGVDEALAELRAVYELEPENPDALGALERLYRQTERFEDLLQIYERKRELAIDPVERREILHATASLYENELKNPAKAIECYRSVLDDEPQDSVALEALDALYRAQNEYEAYADILRRRLELDVPEAVVVDLKLRLGQTLERNLGDPPGALE